MFEADVYEKVIVTDVVLGSSDKSSSANAAEVDISNNKINVANSDESSTAKTTERFISDDKISVFSREVPRKGQNCSGSHLKRCYDMEELKKHPALILEFTGLENYEKFLTVYYSLRRKVQKIKIKGNGSHCHSSSENQFLPTSWKLRKNCTDIEPAAHFNITKFAVGNIPKTWVIFMAKQWSIIDLYPCRDLGQYHMSQRLKEDFQRLQ
ncbi:hypothetical protein QAD02_002628 [Eretmocerus hayati]|uniref:Uncharacterized protein n=1 Tax=Eretmocerus hayati TaxID=131215 RepID=A0ACC2NJQ6_9HYME|nr:hypothetical protein QAD02_002628 [Eretmocerus hayati]